MLGGGEALTTGELCDNCCFTQRGVVHVVGGAPILGTQDHMQEDLPIPLKDFEYLLILGQSDEKDKG